MSTQWAIRAANGVVCHASEDVARAAMTEGGYTLGINRSPIVAALTRADATDEWQEHARTADWRVIGCACGWSAPGRDYTAFAEHLRDLGTPTRCDGCNVREPWEHRCHGEPCACEDCREERRIFEIERTNP